MLIYNSKKFLSKYGIWLIFLIFILTTFNFFSQRPFDHMETSYFKVSTWNFEKIIFKNWGDQLPFWFIVTKFYIQLFGGSDVSLKIIIVSTFLLSAFILYKLCEVYEINKYIVTALFLFNPLLLKQIASVFKHFSFLILISLLVFYLFEKYKNSKSRKYFFFLFVAIFAGMYSNLIFLIFFFAFAIYVFINLFLKKISFKFFSFFIITSAVFALPLFYYYEKAKSQLFNVGVTWGTSARGLDFIKEAISIISGTNHLNKTLSSLLFVLLIFLFCTQFFLIREKKLIFLKIWTVLVFFFIITTMMFMTGRTPVADRYFALSVPFFYLAIFPKSKKKYILLISLLIFSITAFSSWQMIKNYKAPGWKEVAAFLKPQIKKNTQILTLYRFNEGDVLAEYYLKTPTTQFSSIKNDSILYSNDIWIIRLYGSFDAIYKMENKYDIKEYNDFRSIKLFHLTKKKPSENNTLIFNEPLVTIEDNKGVREFLFLNGSISGLDYDSLQDWQKIRLRTMKSGGVEKVCLFAHPQENAKINIVYKGVKLEQTIKITTGIAEDMIAKNLSSVYMNIYINDKFIKKIIQPNKWNWQETIINTNNYKNEFADIRFTIYSDNYQKRHFCFDAEITDENDYFYQNIKNANVSVDKESCKIYKTEPIFPHNEKKPPFIEAAIFDRWDCEENLISKNRIWNTAGKSYAVSDGEFKEAIWFHPENNKIKTLEYKNINLETKKITGFYGLNDLALSNKIDKAILTFTVTANEEKIYEDKFSPTKGWKKFEIPFNKNLENVIFSIETTDNRWNHFFFNAFLEQ